MKKENCECAFCDKNSGSLWVCAKANTSAVVLNQEPYKAFIQIKQSREEFKKSYTLRGRLGIYFGVLIGMIDLVLD